MLQLLTILFFANALTLLVSAFHDCIEASNAARRRRRAKILGVDEIRSKENGSGSSCSGGLCVGMKNGPHEGGNSSYPVAWNGVSGTFVQSKMTVPELPKHVDGITYYIWTDVFFGDASLGRMNQFVPQLILGSALDSSSGPPDYEPDWHTHHSWVFGAHYFFETFDNNNPNTTQAHAAYGDLYPTYAGEILFTTFSITAGGDGMDTKSPKWTLTMGVVGDSSRISKLVVERPYMGMGVDWDEPTSSWAEPAFHNMCINSCWELYGADDRAHLPSSGSTYELQIKQPEPNLYEFTSWEEDEGNGTCPSCKVKETHDQRFQNVTIEIDVVASMDQPAIDQ